MKDNKKSKKGLGEFFKRDNQEINSYNLDKNSLFSNETGDPEKTASFFSQNQMKNLHQEDLSELIKKIQTQKDESRNTGINKIDNIDSGQTTTENKFDFNEIISHDKKTGVDISKDYKNDNKTNNFSELISAGKTKPILSQKPLIDENNQKKQEINTNQISFEPLTESDDIQIQNINKTNASGNSSSEKAETNNKSESEINNILLRIKKAENIILSTKKDLSQKSEENISDNSSSEKTGNIILNSKTENQDFSGNSLNLSKEIAGESNPKGNKKESELEKILGKIKKAESKTEEYKNNTKNDDLEKSILKGEIKEEPLLISETSNTHTSEEPEIKTFAAEENNNSDHKSENSDSSKTDTGKDNEDEVQVVKNLSAEDEIEEPDNREILKPEKKYTANKTKWSQPEPEGQEDSKAVEHADNIERKTLYSAKKTRWSESDSEIDDKEAGLVSVNEIDKSYSGLILPEGATFEIEEFKVKSLKKELEPEEHNATISKIDKIYSEYFPPIDLDRLNEIDLSETKIKEKQGLFKKLKQDKKDKYEYNPSIHGPIVDLSFKEADGVEEVELYPVNEPYAYVRIVFDKNSNEYLYKSIEPVLNEAENKLLSEIEQRLFETLDVNTKDMTKEKAREILKESVNEIIADYGLKFTPAERAKIIYHIHREFLGDGLIDPIMHDKYIEDISCDGLNTPIFVFHSNYESLQTNLVYKDTAVLDSFVTRLAQRAGKYISIAEPMLDATMSDGSRIQMTLGTEVTAHGSTFTIRKFKDEPITPTDLTEWGTFSPLSIAYIWLAVEAGKSCIFAGGTASGKTTSLNAISLFIPPLAKIVTLEDTRELKLPHLNWIPSVTRESFDKEGKGSIDMYELLKAALRQRPEYILVGEVRGAEAQTLFQAMSTGHVTYATMHADSVASAVHRIENPPLNVPRNMLSSLDLMSVQVQARIGGQRIRRNKQLIEILDIDPRTKELITNEVFKWHQSTDEIRYSGKSYILEDIMESRGWDEARMVEELKRRQEILEWMRIKKLRNYKDVGKVLMSYYRDSEAVIKLVREDLYE